MSTVKTKSDLERFYDRFFEILETKEPTRTGRLVNLMNDLERTYQIPTYQENTAVMHLYRCVGRARDL